MFNQCVVFRFFQQLFKWFNGKLFWTMHDRTEFTQVTDNLLNLSEALKGKDK